MEYKKAMNIGVVTPEMMTQLDIINRYKKDRNVLLICVDGLDSSGKAYIVKSLTKKLLQFVQGNKHIDINFKTVAFPRYETLWGKQIRYNLDNITGENRDNVKHSRLYIEDRIDYFMANYNPGTPKHDIEVIITDRGPISNLICNLHQFKSVGEKNKYMNDAMTECLTYSYDKIYIIHRADENGAKTHREYLKADKASREVDLNESEDNQAKFNDNIMKLKASKSLNKLNLCEYINIGDSEATAQSIFADISVSIMKMLDDLNK